MHKRLEKNHKRRREKTSTFPDYVRKSIKDSPFNVMLILIVAFGFINLNIYQVKEINNPCVEWYDDCELDCWGSGTEYYDCECIYPCKKRKYD